MSLAAENVGEAYIFNIAFHWSHMYITDSSNVRMWPHDSHIHADSSPEVRVQFEMSPRPGYSSRSPAPSASKPKYILRGHPVGLGTVSVQFSMTKYSVTA